MVVLGKPTPPGPLFLRAFALHFGISPGTLPHLRSFTEQSYWQKSPAQGFRTDLEQLCAHPFRSCLLWNQASRNPSQLPHLAPVAKHHAGAPGKAEAHRLGRGTQHLDPRAIRSPGEEDCASPKSGSPVFRCILIRGIYSICICCVYVH